MKSKSLFIKSLAVVATLLVAGTALAWTAPGQGPPNGNVLPPINTSTSDQTKTGGLLNVYGLWVNQALGVTGGGTFGGNLTTSGSISASGNLTVSGTATIGGQAVCLGNGTNCPAGAAPTWASITGKPYPVNGQTWNWNGQGGQPSYLWGSNDGTNMYVWNPANFNVSQATLALHLNVGNVGSTNWTWSGQGGQPAWMWGSNDGTNMYVWNPSNFSVNYATNAGTASNANALGGLPASSYVQLNAWQGGHYSATNGYEYAVSFVDANNYSYYTMPSQTSVFNVMYLSYFYDLQNSGYYIDLNNTSRINNIVADSVSVAGSAVCTQNGTNCPQVSSIGGGGTYTSTVNNDFAGCGHSTPYCYAGGYMYGFDYHIWSNTNNCGFVQHQDTVYCHY